MRSVINGSVIDTTERAMVPARAARRVVLRRDGTPTRVTKRRAETRGRLMGAATTLFAEKGFGQVGIEQICEAAGYTRGAFYSNFVVSTNCSSPSTRRAPE